MTARDQVAARVHLSFAWNRLRYYWPQARTRRDAGRRLAAESRALGGDWKPPRHWLIPDWWW